MTRDPEYHCRQCGMPDHLCHCRPLHGGALMHRLYRRDVGLLLMLAGLLTSLPGVLR